MAVSFFFLSQGLLRMLSMKNVLRYVNVQSHFYKSTNPTTKMDIEKMQEMLLLIENGTRCEFKKEIGH